MYATEATAHAAAKAEAARRKRAPATLDLDLALGRPDLYPERKLTVTGFKPDIDGRHWLIVEVDHRFDGGGLRTRLKLESI